MLPTRETTRRRLWEDLELDSKNAVHISTKLGTTVVEALRYKPEGRGFDFRWCHWDFSLTYSFRPHYGPGVDSASNRYEYPEYFVGVKAAGAYG